MNDENSVIFISGSDGPIEGRYSGKGKPWAVSRRGRPLNNRQKKLLDRLLDIGSRALVRKNSVSMSDLAALTAETKAEFAMFTCGSRRLIIRGDDRCVYIEEAEVERLIAQGYKWSGHTHPGYNMSASVADADFLKRFGQSRSVIYNISGECRTFAAG